MLDDRVWCRSVVDNSFNQEMRADMGALRLIQLLILVVVPLDAFALAGARVNGGARLQPQGLPVHRNVRESQRFTQNLQPPSRSEVANTVLAVSGGGDGSQV